MKTLGYNIHSLITNVQKYSQKWKTKYRKNYKNGLFKKEYRDEISVFNKKFHYYNGKQNIDMTHIYPVLLILVSFAVAVLICLFSVTRLACSECRTERGSEYNTLPHHLLWTHHLCGTWFLSTRFLFKNPTLYISNRLIASPSESWFNFSRVLPNHRPHRKHKSKGWKEHTKAEIEKGEKANEQTGKETRL